MPLRNEDACHELETSTQRNIARHHSLNFFYHSLKYEQELSYRKQIERQLRTQYVEGICDNPLTLKSRLTVTQSHWKQNH